MFKDGLKSVQNALKKSFPPTVYIEGNTFCAEGVKKVLSVEKDRVKLLTEGGLILVFGTNICVENMHDDLISIKGNISSVEFEEK